MTPRQLLGQARVRTFEYVPYLASYIYSLRERETPGIGTAAVDDAGNLYWDANFISKIGVDQGAYLVTHEVLHLIFEHHARAREMVPNPTPQQQFILNLAADLVIEQTLAHMRHLRPDGAVHLGCQVPSMGITLDFPANKSMQEYYRLILDRLPKPPQDESGSNTQQQENDDGSQGNDGDSEDDAGGDKGTGGRGGDGDGEPEDGEGDSQGGAGEGGDDDSTNGQANGNGAAGHDDGPAGRSPCSPGSGGSCADGVPRKYEVESDGSWETYGQDIAAAAVEKYESDNPGSVPGSIKAAIKARLHPTPDPFAQLRSAVCTSVASPVGGRDFSHRRRSKKQPPGDDQPLLHGRITVQPHAVVIVDTSASMMTTDIHARALSVIAQGLRKLGRVKVYCADTKVQSHATVTHVRTFDWHGGGGTDMATAVAEVDKADRPDSIVLITDAETHWRGEKPRARVVVAYTGRAGSQWHKAIPSWCRTVVLNTQEA
jgi:predicted metal-dependent peptidase